MPIISQSNLQTLIDRIARHVGEFAGDAALTLAPNLDAAFNGGLIKANSDVLAAIQTSLVGIADADVDTDLVPAINALNAANPILNALAAGIWNPQLDAIDRHMRRFANSGGSLLGLDGYLTIQNAANGMSAGFRANGLLRSYLGRLSPTNCFVPSHQTGGTFAATGASIGTFTAGTAIATSLYAGSQVAVQNNGAVTSGATLTITCVDLTGASHIITATIASGTSGTITNCGDTSKIYQSITTVSITSGTNGNNYNILFLADRRVDNV